MDQQQFLAELAGILEVGSLTLDRPLTDGNWDSVAMLSTITLVDQLCDVSLSGRELSQCTTPQDILDLIDRTKA
jgi:acyl carrier protein